MAEYIDREKLLVAFESEEGAEILHHSIIDLFDIQEFINAQEKADVVEVKHGKWQEERWCDNFQHTCSVCNRTVRVHPQSVAYRYCPYCGAKMDKRSDTE